MRLPTRCKIKGPFTPTLDGCLAVKMAQTVKEDLALRGV